MRTLILLMILAVGSNAAAQLQIGVETGSVWSGYNDVRIPGDTGSLISLSQELETGASPFFRVKLQYPIADRHWVTLLVAPLRLRAEGRVDRIIRFEDKEFPPNVMLKSVYRFDSYRIGYRYDLYRTPGFLVGLGLTAKLRDASISLESDTLFSEKKNTGFVPLISFLAEWRVKDGFSLLFDGEALGAPQGRAEDVLLGVRYDLSTRVGLGLGYRILEGGADVDEVYNFTLIHYLVLGATLHL